MGMGRVKISFERRTSRDRWCLTMLSGGARRDISATSDPVCTGKVHTPDQDSLVQNPRMKVENEPTGSVDLRAFKETLAPPKTWNVVAAFDEFVARSRVEKLQSDPIEIRTRKEISR